MRGVINGLPLAAALWVLIGGAGALLGVHWLMWGAGALAAVCVVLSAVAWALGGAR